MALVEAATVVLLRRVPRSKPTFVSLSGIPASLARGWSSPQEWPGFEQDKLVFSSGWQVLLGQSECQNWLKSEPGNPVPMRYAGEWKFPGGRVELGETLQECAWRELQEEFGASPSSTDRGTLRLFNTKRTKAVRGTAFQMHNFVCLQDENPWMEGIVLDELNGALAQRREEFAQLLENGRFWALDRPARELIAPEVRRLEWLDVGSAVELMMGSKAVELRPVDAWQEREFARLGITRRDPMFQTFATLLELEQCATEDGVRARCLEMEQHSRL